MSRLRNAWNALLGIALVEERLVEVEKIVEKSVPVDVVKEVIGSASTTMLYAYDRDTGRKETKTIGTHHPISYTVYETLYCGTCEQAHAEANGATVLAVPCIKVGTSYFRLEDIRPVKLRPKPKVAKGKKGKAS